MHTALAHGFAIGFAIALTLAGWRLDLHLLSTLGGAYMALSLEQAGRALLATARPASRAERRMARAVESTVRQRSLTMDRDTGAHAA